MRRVGDDGRGDLAAAARQNQQAHVVAAEDHLIVAFAHGGSDVGDEAILVGLSLLDVMVGAGDG